MSSGVKADGQVDPAAGLAAGIAPAGDRRLKFAAWTAAALTATLALGCVVLEIVGPGPPEVSADPDAGSGGVLLVTIHALVAAAFAVLGALVVSRQPRNPVGWLLVLIGFSFMYIAASNQLYLQVVLNTGDASGITAYVVWGGNWAWLFAIVPAFTFLPLLFPTGRLPGPGWRALAWFTAGAVTLVLVGSGFKAGPLDGASAVDNPLGIDLPAFEIVAGVGTNFLLPAALASITSLVLRFRRSSGVERQQVKWVASAAALLPVALLFGLGLGGDASWPLILITLMVVAGAITVAMLRFRLYEAPQV